MGQALLSSRQGQGGTGPSQAFCPPARETAVHWLWGYAQNFGECWSGSGTNDEGPGGPLWSGEVQGTLAPPRRSPAPQTRTSQGEAARGAGQASACTRMAGGLLEGWAKQGLRLGDGSADPARGAGNRGGARVESRGPGGRGGRRVGEDVRRGHRGRSSASVGARRPGPAGEGRARGGTGQPVLVEVRRPAGPRDVCREAPKHGQGWKGDPVRRDRRGRPGWLRGLA